MNIHAVLSTVFLAQFLGVVIRNVGAEVWSHHTVLDSGGKYHLYWTPPEDKYGDSEITFRVEVQAKGYVGFGLSPTGGMTGCDIVTGWIKDGKTFFQDRHGVGNLMPPKDEKQDWVLIEATENGTHTHLQFKRKLNTCDEKDMVIDDSTMRVIYAFSDEDPDGENPSYHSINRGTKSVMLLQDKKHLSPNKEEDDDSFLKWDILSPNFDISEYRTVYWCKIFKGPSLRKKHHIVKVEPLIQKGHKQFLHHMLLFECVGGTPEEYEGFLDVRGHECFHPNMPDVYKKCEGLSVAWAIGGEELIFPPHVGMPLETVPEKYFMIEIHYDNPHLTKGIIDHSGLRIHYTPHLREYDAGCLMFGSPTTPRMFIPPGQEKYEVTGHSNTECLGPAIPEGGIKALGILLHAHLLGRKIKARHFRGNRELPPLAEENNYDFNYQEYRYYNDEVSILPGDQITTECIYDSSKKHQPTYGGISTQEEMCLSFVLYYPKIDRYGDLSIPPFLTINKVLKTNITDDMSFYSLNQYDWASVNINELEKTLVNAEHETECYLGDGQKNTVKSLVSYPKNLKPFLRTDTCGNRDVNSRALSQKNSVGNLRKERKTFYYLIPLFLLFFSLTF